MRKTVRAFSVVRFCRKRIDAATNAPFNKQPSTANIGDAAPMATPRHGHAIASLGGLVYVMGGCNDAACTSVEAYDIARDAWAPIAAMATARYYAAAAALGGRIFVTGNWGYGSTSAEAFGPQEESALTQV